MAGAGGAGVEEGDRNEEAGGAAMGVVTGGEEAGEGDGRRRESGRVAVTGGAVEESSGTKTGGVEDSMDGSRDARELSRSLWKVTAVVVITVFEEGRYTRQPF